MQKKIENNSFIKLELDLLKLEIEKRHRLAANVDKLESRNGKKRDEGTKLSRDVVILQILRPKLLRIKHVNH